MPHAAEAASVANELARLPWKEAREQHLASFEASYAQAVLARCGGNVSAAAREAGIDRKTFYTLLRRDREASAGEFIPQFDSEDGEPPPQLP